MTPDELALLAAILADPGDDTPRLVYADWLDENADERCHKCDGAGTQPCPTTPDFSQTCSACWGKGSGRRERAEFIRVQCELETGLNPKMRYLSHTPECKCRWCDLRRRERGLLKSHGDEWFGVDLRDENRDTTEPLPPLRTSRGFVEYVACSWEAFAGGECRWCYGPGRDAVWSDRCGHCDGTGRTPGIADKLVWRAEVACEECRLLPARMCWPLEDGGQGYVCPACHNSRLVRNPDPPPPTAQPVREVVLRDATGIEGERIVITTSVRPGDVAAMVGGGRVLGVGQPFHVGRFPGITFRLT
jgi:uncharacterized protein (TIGR02996 family)